MSVVKKTRKKYKFRLQAKKFFLTIPHIQNTIDFPSLFSRISNVFEDTNYICAAYEPHKNGSLHAHLLISFKAKKQVFDPHFFDFIFNKYGKYETVRNLRAILAYIKKNQNHAEWGNKLETNASLLTQIRQRLEAVSSVHQIFDTSSEALRDEIFKQSYKIEAYYRKFQAQSHINDLKRLPGIKGFDLNPLLSVPAKNPLKPYASNMANLLQHLQQEWNPKNRHYKQLNIHIWSHLPNTGKSSFLNLLAEICPIYIWPTDHWYQHYENNLYQAIVWDEFTLTGYKQEFIKLIFAGGPLKLPVKGSQTNKLDNPIIICASNHSLRQHVHRKYSSSCSCSPDSLHPSNLCQNPSVCGTPDNALIYYKTLHARILDYEIKEGSPIWPTNDPALWQSFKDLLFFCLIFLNPPQPS